MSPLQGLMNKLASLLGGDATGYLIAPLRGCHGLFQIAFWFLLTTDH
jgi:hypothetical protein